MKFPWLGLYTFTAEDSGSSPSQKLRAHKLHSEAKKKKKGEGGAGSEDQNTTHTGDLNHGPS